MREPATDLSTAPATTLSLLEEILNSGSPNTTTNASTQVNIVPPITQGDHPAFIFTTLMPTTTPTSNDQSMNATIVLIAGIVVAVAIGLFFVLFKRKHNDERTRVPSVCLSKSRYAGANVMSVFDTYACGAHIMLHSPEGTMREREPSIVLGALGRVDEWYGSQESTANDQAGEFDIRVSETSNHTSFKL